jgi:hypothetical protein
LDLFGQRSERGSERARRARLDHKSSSRGRVSPLRCSWRASSARRRNFPGSDASFSLQAVSSSKVSIICEAMASCSSRGSAATLRKASSSSSVMTAVYQLRRRVAGGEWLRGSDQWRGTSDPTNHSSSSIDWACCGAAWLWDGNQAGQGCMKECLDLSLLTTLVSADPVLQNTALGRNDYGLRSTP